MQAESWHPKSNTATHGVTLLALKRKKRMELATETTCRPVGTAGNPARRASVGKASLEMRWRHYRNLDSSKIIFQKLTHRRLYREIF